ncbi:hypothetical protein EMCRGX_G019427 [Ephydatia muelleri]|eukprot:Em0011g564a
MRGQGYDGASNMSSDRVGVQAWIQQAAPLATYVHCSGHCFKSCSLLDIHNVMDRLEHSCRFFLNSLKQSKILELIVTENVPDSPGRKPLLDLCRTCWAEHHSAYQHFYQAYSFIVQALELIRYCRHLDKYGDKYADWDTVNRTEAQQILTSITSFAFIVSFTCVYLSHLAGITVKLQKRSLDIMDAHELIAEVTATYEGRQQHRSNPSSLSVEDYFKKTVAIPLLDHIITSMKDCFSVAAIVTSSLLGVIPSVCCSKEVNMERAIEKYKDDLPSPELTSTELRRWKAQYSAWNACGPSTEYSSCSHQGL